MSLAYAQTHPSRCTGLILRGIFTFLQEEIDFLFKKGASCELGSHLSHRPTWETLTFQDIWPEEWERFESLIPPEKRNNLVEEYYKLLTSENDEEKLEAARRWAMWEGSIALLVPLPGGLGDQDDIRWTL